MDYTCYVCEVICIMTFCMSIFPLIKTATLYNISKITPAKEK